MRITNRWLVAVACALIASLAFAQSPNSVVEDAVTTLDEQLNSNKDQLADDSEALYAMIDEILLPRFDRKYAAQLVLGKHWRDATEEQRGAFIDAFYASLRKRYADGLLKFEQDNVVVLPYRGDDSKKRTIVKTSVVLNDGTKVPVNYGLVKREDGWLIFDVIIEGISYIQNFRAELNSEISRTSLDAVIERLEAEVAPKTEMAGTDA